MPVGRKRPSQVPPGETETWMSGPSAAAANGAPLNPPSPSRSPCEQITLKAEPGQSRQGRQGARAVVHMGRLQFEVEPRAMLGAEGEQLDALDQFAAIDAAHPSGRGGAERAAINHHRRG